MSMKIKETNIAKKYAQAFLNLYADYFTKKNLKKNFDLEDFLKQNKEFYMLLRLTKLPRKIKQQALTKIAKAYSINTHMSKLMHILLEQGRISILHLVLKQIRLCYKKRYNIENFLITTSHPIDTKIQNNIIRFIRSKANATVLSTFVVDQTLIIGMRIESNTFLWERSIKKQLSELRNNMLGKG